MITIRAYHEDCPVHKDFAYDGSYGQPTEREMQRFHRVWRGLALTEGDIRRRFGSPRVFAMCALASGEYRLFTRVISLPKSIRPKECYSTLFGPCFWGPWNVYGSSQHNLERAFTRSCSVRASESELVSNQARISPRNWRRGGHKVRLAIFWELRRRITRVLREFTHEFDEQIKYALSPHIKLSLRKRALADLINQANMYGLFVYHINGKLKLYEKAKPGKYPRLIGDYTTPGSLLGGFLCAVAKKQFGVLQHHEVRFEFISSIEPEVLDTMGERILSSPTPQFYYHSDDGLCSFSGRLFESDISSCDMSNGDSIFGTAAWLFKDTPYHDLMERTIKQCTNIVKLRNPEGAGCIKLKPTRPKELSGTVLTTLLNNIASLNIFISASVDGLTTPGAFVESAKKAGYNITMAERSSLDTAQFLKHSWDTTVHPPRSWLNLGAMLRSFGSCDGPMPVRNAENARRAWNRVVVSGYQHSGKTSVYRKLLSVLPEHTYPLRQLKDMVNRAAKLHKHTSTSRRGDISDVSLQRRYQFRAGELEHFVSTISDRAMHVHSALSKIWAVDYGL